MEENTSATFHLATAQNVLDTSLYEIQWVELEQGWAIILGRGALQGFW